MEWEEWEWRLNLGMDSPAALRVLIPAVLMALLWGISAVYAAEPRIDFDAVTFSSSRTPSGTVRFLHGEHRERAAPGSAAELVVTLTDHQAVGIVNGAQTAGVVIVTDLGGSGTFYDVALLVKGPDGWRHVDTVFLGDRLKIHSVALQGDRMIIDMTMHGPQDPMCCPTRRVTRRFAVNTGRLIAVEKDSINGGLERR
jgi:hypothetical protein